MATELQPQIDRAVDIARRPVSVHRRGEKRLSRVRYVLLTMAILVCALLGSNYWYQSRLQQQLDYYPYTWKTNWLQSPYRDRTVACFRKVIYVPGNVEHAYLAVAGDNLFQLTVNGSPAVMFFHPDRSYQFLPLSEPSPYTELGMARHSRSGAIFNIRNMLVPGRNVICVMAETDEDRAPRIAVQGEIQAGATQQIVSDTTWKCSPQEQSRLGIFWNSIRFDDLDWKPAEATSDPVDAYVDGDPSALTDPEAGRYITALGTNETSPLILRKAIVCPPGDNYGYLRVAATTRYDLSVNGYLIAGQSTIDRYGPGIVKEVDTDAATNVLNPSITKAQKFTATDIQSASSVNRTSFDVYQFRNAFHAGANTITVTLHRPESTLNWSIPQFYLDGKIHRQGFGDVSLQTDSSWTASEPAGDASRLTVLGRPGRFATSSIYGAQFAHPVAVDAPMYAELGKDGALFLIALLLVCGAVGLATGEVSLGGVLTRAAACIVLPLTFMMSTLLLQWIFAWSPQNEFLAARPFGSFVLACAFGLFVVNAVAVLSAAVWRSRSRPVVEFAAMSRREAKRSNVSVFMDRYGFASVLAVIMAAAAFLYIHGLAHEAYIPDEYVSLLAAQGILHRGIPLYENSNILYPRSSLYHYTLALFLALARNQHNLAYTRIPSVLYQLALIPLTYIYGRELRSKWVGLAAAAIVAFSPYLEYFAREVRFYSQFGFYATLMFYMLLRSVRNPDAPKYRAGAILAFCAAYLSQQVIMGVLPAVLALLLFARQTRLWFEWKTLRWLILASGVVLADLGSYFLWCETPLPFIDSMAKPLMGFHADEIDRLPLQILTYVEREQLVVGLLFIAGLCGAVWALISKRTDDGTPWSWWKFHYLLIPASIVLMDAILPHPSPRYVCNLFPAIVLTACCVVQSLLNYVGRWFRDEVRAPSLSRVMQAAIVIAFAALFIAEARPVRSYNETGRRINRDVTGCCDYVRRNMRPGDKLMFFTPEVAMVEFGRCEYSWRPMRAPEDKYISADGRLRERNSAAIVIDSPDKLRRIMAKEQRIWLVISPRSDVDTGPTGVMAVSNFDVAYENFGSEVLLWDRNAHRYYEVLPDHHRDQFNF